MNSKTANLLRIMTYPKTVVSKSALKQQISKILRSLLRLLEANYPDTFESKCREFGFIRKLY